VPTTNLGEDVEALLLRQRACTWVSCLHTDSQAFTTQ